MATDPAPLSAPFVRGFTGFDHLRGLSGTEHPRGFGGGDHLRAFAVGDTLRVLEAGRRTYRPPLFGYDPDFPKAVFVYERAAWLSRDGEEVALDLQAALGRGIRITVEDEEVVMLL